MANTPDQCNATVRLPWTRAQKPAPAKERVHPRFSGFAEDPPDLYEFLTSEGEHICLHEMDCVSFHFNPMSRRLDLAFEIIGASTVMRYPLTVTLSFDETQFLQWHDDPSDLSTLAASREPTRIRGQVSDLSYNKDGSFSLQLFDLDLSYEAVSVTCLVRPGLWELEPVPRSNGGADAD